jgi:hypothetical protein
VCIENSWVFSGTILVLSQDTGIESLLWLMHLDMKTKNSMRGLGLVHAGIKKKEMKAAGYS